jgi:hypothetical protein
MKHGLTFFVLLAATGILSVPWGRLPTCLSSEADWQSTPRNTGKMPVAPSTGETPAARAVPAEGDPFAAALAGVDGNWQITLDVGGKPRTMPAADLAWWGTCNEPAKGPVVVLARGGLLAADVTGADKDQLAAESDLLGTLKLPLDSLAGVVLRLPADRHGRDRLLDRVASAAGESDRLLLDNGDEVTGLIEAIDGGQVKLKAEVGPLTVEFRRIVAVIFNPALRQKPAGAGFFAWVGLSDGSRVPAERLVVNAATAELTVIPGQTWTAASKELVLLQPIGGRATYLSDLKPAEYRHLPYLSLAWPYRRDRNVTGGLLRGDGRLYLKGLGVHSAARLTYLLEPGWKRFRAELGIDDSTEGRGSVDFRVFVDKKQVFISEPIRGGGRPVPLSIDLAGAKRLDLVVDYGEQGDVMDHADWLEARLVK